MSIYLNIFYLVLMSVLFSHKHMVLDLLVQKPVHTYLTREGFNCCYLQNVMKKAKEINK